MGGSMTVRVPWVAIVGFHARPVVITACSWRRIAAAITVWAWVAVSCFSRGWSGACIWPCRRCCRVVFPRPRATRPDAVLPAGTSEFGAPEEPAGQFLPRREAGVFDQGAAGGEAVWVAGLGQDRRRSDR